MQGVAAFTERYPSTATLRDCILSINLFQRPNQTDRRGNFRAMIARLVIFDRGGIEKPFKTAQLLRHH